MPDSSVMQLMCVNCCMCTQGYFRTGPVLHNIPFIFSWSTGKHLLQPGCYPACVCKHWFSVWLTVLVNVICCMQFSVFHYSAQSSKSNITFELDCVQNPDSDSLPCWCQSFCRVLCNLASDCMRNSKKSSSIPYSAVVTEMEKWSRISLQERITTKR